MTAISFMTNKTPDKVKGTCCERIFVNHKHVPEQWNEAEQNEIDKTTTNYFETFINLHATNSEQRKKNTHT